MPTCLVRVLCGARLLILVGVCCGSAGCGKSERLVPVQGQVTVRGRPLPLGTVVFHPDADKGNTSQQEPRGTIDAEGKYSLKTGDREGAPLGWYRVAIFAIKPGTEKGDRPVEWLVQFRYTNPKESGLAVEVTDHPRPGGYDFQLQPFSDARKP